MFFHQHFTNLLRLKTFTLIMDQSSIFDYVCVIVGHFMLATDIIFRLYVAFFSSRDIGIGVWAMKSLIAVFKDDFSSTFHLFLFSYEFIYNSVWPAKSLFFPCLNPVIESSFSLNSNCSRVNIKHISIDLRSAVSYINLSIKLKLFNT